MSSTNTSAKPDIIYHEPLTSTSPPPPPEPPPTPPPPPPLPKRNSDSILNTTEHSIIYGHNSGYPQLQINIPSTNGYSSLESKLSDRSKLQALIRRPSLPSRIVTHELNLARMTPQSEVESLVIETNEYVRDMKRRRNDIHATLMRTRTPGERLRRMLGYKIEQRLVKVLSTRKSRTSTKKRKSTKKPTHADKNEIKRKRFSPREMFYKLTKKAQPQQRRYFLDFDKFPDSNEGESSRCPTPRFIVDRQGEVRWPPFKISEKDIDTKYDKESPEETGVESLGIENFSLRKPQSLTEPSSELEVPRVLGWLQVNSDSHIFTPAIAQNTEKSGKNSPFKKAPFHSNMHVLKTKI